MSVPGKPAVPTWVSTRHLQHMVRQAETAGLAEATLLDAAGLSRARLADADGMIPLSAIEALLTALDQQHAGAMVGLQLAREIQPASFGALGLLLQSCTTLADVLEALVRFNGLLSNIGTTTLAFGPGTVEVRWECAAGSPAFRRHASEYVLGIFVVFARLLLPGHAHLPRAVHFAHDLPAGADPGRDYFSFFQCPVYFGQAFSAIVIPVSLLKARLRHGDTALKELLERHTLNLLKERTLTESLHDDVKRLVCIMMADGTPTREMVAAQLGMSTRSLHRHLQESGTGFRHIMDEVRLETAQQRLLEHTDSISEIADRLGFSSHQAFLRWFRQHTGKTPGEFRKEETHTNGQ